LLFVGHISFFILSYGSSICVQGGPAKVKPTYIFAGNIILVTFECIGKIQWLLANVITV